MKNRRGCIGILDHTGSELGGGQLVAGCMAETLSRHFEVEVIESRPEHNLERLSRAFSLDLGLVRLRTVSEVSESFQIPGPRGIIEQLRKSNSQVLSQPYDLFIYSGHGAPPLNYACSGLVYCHFPFESRPDERSLRCEPRWLERNKMDRWLRLRAYQYFWQKRMRGYDKILTNSHFTAGWIERRWARRAEVLYPPIQMTVPPAGKRNLIVSVARFTGGKRSKHQLEMVRAFREFVAQAGAQWELTLIGSCEKSVAGPDYLQAVRYAAQGLPVTFLVNENREVICRSLAEAQFFWHAAGLLIDETQQPDEAEHFGVATVEAMRAGCVPVVIASGGQREIIQDGVNGFLAHDLSELVQKSITLTRQEKVLLTMGRNARQRSLAFTRSVFDRQISEIVAQCLHSRPT